MALCPSCQRPEALHKPSSKTVHLWPRIMCSKEPDPKYQGRGER
mgnify:CR=1 FL=1